MQTGSKNQEILKKKGDDVRIDWGYFYLAADKKNSKCAIGNSQVLRKGFISNELVDAPTEGHNKLALVHSLGVVDKADGHLLIGYDDIYSIQYFEDKLRPYWNRDNNKTIISELQDANNEYKATMEKCAEFDSEMMNKATAAGGRKYAELCALAYRQAIAAHKLVQASNGDLLFLSKENFSNGSIGTVDVTYPSAPLFLLYNPELAKGLLNHIFYYSESGKWNKPFAAHERKWEIDSLCYPLRLAYHYWKTTGDSSIFDEEWVMAITNILKTFKEQQRKGAVGPYKFQRKTERALDTLNNDGLGAPIKPIGLIVSWSEGAEVRINGKKANVKLTKGKYVCIEREWKDGDKVLLNLPMSLSMRTWQVNKNSISVDYGPLTLSLKIDERYVEKDSRETAIGDSKWQKGADSKKWPTTEIYANSSCNLFQSLALLGICFLFPLTSQAAKGGKKISSDLFGLFFEDINYSADGGLYAELVQNRSFEYNPTERKEWNPFSFWEYITPGFSYGKISVETSSPIHPNNPHYMNYLL